MLVVVLVGSWCSVASTLASCCHWCGWRLASWWSAVSTLFVMLPLMWLALASWWSAASTLAVSVLWLSPMFGAGRYIWFDGSTRDPGVTRLSFSVGYWLQIVQVSLTVSSPGRDFVLLTNVNLY